jgi:microcystin-dependent protein
MGTPYLSEIRLISFNFAPKGWAFCNGQILPINQNQALFSLLGTTYGGNGQTTFALPNLQGRTILHFGPDSSGNAYVLGQSAGEASVALTLSQMPAHSHVAQGISVQAYSYPAAGRTWAESPSNPYSSNSNTVMNPSSLSQVGGNQPHNNMPPYLTLNFIIALAGIFPSRN